MASSLQLPVFKHKEEFRNYIEPKECVSTTYSLNHKLQTVEFVTRMHQEYSKFNVSTGMTF